MIEDSEPFVLTGVVAAEVLQGLTRDAGRIEAFLGQWEFLEPRGIATYREAARIFRAGRSKGLSLTTMDTIMAAIAIEQDASVFTLDRDFAGIGRIAPLKLYSF
jgi:predicted nucleic acid-binding protein